MTLNLITREELLSQNNALAWYLYAWQRSTFNPEEDPFEEGEEVFLEIEDEEPTKLSAEMAQKLNDDYAEQCRACCDNFETPPLRPGYEGFLIAELPAEPIETYFAAMGKAVRQLARQFGDSSVVLISMSRTPYLIQENDHPPVARATALLLEMGITKDYQDGMELQSDSIEQIIESMFWIARCNASAPYICFTIAGTAFVGSLCKYGNIHFDCFDQIEEGKLVAALKRTGFRIPEDGMCEERLSPDSAMEGRRLDIS